MNQIRYCYQRELTKNPELGGKVVVKFVIAKDGTVSSGHHEVHHDGQPRRRGLHQRPLLALQVPRAQGRRHRHRVVPLHLLPGLAPALVPVRRREGDAGLRLFWPPHAETTGRGLSPSARSGRPCPTVSTSSHPQPDQTEPTVPIARPVGPGHHPGHHRPCLLGPLPVALLIERRAAKVSHVAPRPPVCRGRPSTLRRRRLAQRSQAMPRRPPRPVRQPGAHCPPHGGPRSPNRRARRRRQGRGARVRRLGIRGGGVTLKHTAPRPTPLRISPLEHLLA
jgi:hypothetical protein